MKMTKLTISPPDGSKRPLKENIFRHASLSNAQLNPLFPYTSPGSIVPCSAAFRSDGKDYGSFHHTNSVDEVSIVWASNVPQFRCGRVFVGAREHQVQGPPAEFPPAYILFNITQRQAESGEQAETVAFFCESCHAELHSFSYDASEEHVVNGSLPIQPTTNGTLIAALGFEGGNCPSCGHDNKVFPHERWGWGECVRRSEICGKALADLKDELASELGRK